MLAELRGRYAHNVVIAIESLKGNRLKSLLTGLGIMFGVSAVISMLAIGSGARQEILEQMKLIGVNNIIVNALDPTAEATGNGVKARGSEQSTGDQSGARTMESATSSELVKHRKFSPGLTPEDAESIVRVIPGVEQAVGVVNYTGEALRGGKRLSVLVKGVTRGYFDVYGLRVQEGSLFQEGQQQRGDAVCVIGSGVRAKLFSGEEALGQLLKFHGVWYRVIGVLPPHSELAATGSGGELGISDYNTTLFIPRQSLSVRWLRRGMLEKVARESEGGSKNGLQPLDQIVVHISDAAYMHAVEDVLERMLARRHQGVKDYQIIVPEHLLKQQQRTRDIFNLVLGAIAGISLLVGGIGIMNIMFATVMERTREIGTRRAIGAKQGDIVSQFLAEAVLISVLGGLLGVILGVVLSLLISQLAGIATVVTWQAVLLSFGVSASVGIIFGLAPARRAAKRSPIESLRYE